MAYAAVRTTSRTVSSPGISSADMAAQRPIRVRSSNTSTRPITLSKIFTEPEVGKIFVAHNCNKVDFPAPFGPRMTQRCPATMEKLIGPRIDCSPRRTVTSVISSTDVPAIEDEDSASVASEWLIGALTQRDSR